MSNFAVAQPDDRPGIYQPPARVPAPEAPASGALLVAPGMPAFLCVQNGGETLWIAVHQITHLADVTEPCMPSRKHGASSGSAPTRALEVYMGATCLYLRAEARQAVLDWLGMAQDAPARPRLDRW